MSFLKKIEPYEDCAPVGVLLPKINLKDKWLNILNLPKDVDSLTFIKKLCNYYYLQKGFNKKINKKEYVDRMKYELSIIDELGFTDYILLNWDILNHCHEEGIPVGRGRGSAGGSLLLSVIGVTDIDPIVNNLIFERFISKNRAKKIEKDGVIYLDGKLLADVDSDIAFDRRSEVIEYINKEHPERVCKIANLVTLSSKICIKEIGKIIGEYSEEEMNAVSSLIPSHYGKVYNLKKAYDEVEKFKKWCDNNKEIFEIAQRLEGLIKNTGVHASGIAISNQILTDICPLELTKEGELVSCYEMETMAQLTVKFDILGLKTLTVLKTACDLAKIDPKTIDENDPFIYQQLQDLKLGFGLFQIEAGTNFGVVQKVKPRNLEELCACLAISRPGAIDYLDQYEKRETDTQEDYLPDSLVNILRETNMVPLYQEQMMRIAYEVFGFTKDDAEALRKIVGKKILDQMPAWKDKIYKQAENLNFDIRVADFYWHLLESSANYSFNKSHSSCYSMLTAATVYMKFKYPLQYYIALLKMARHESDSHEIIDVINKELQQFNIKLLPPDLIKSQMDFSIEDGNIRYGLNCIKGVSEKSLESILKFRKKEANNKFDIFIAAKESKINIGILCALIQAGALNSINDDRAYMVHEAQVFNILTDREKRNWINFGEKHNYDVFKIWNNEVKGANIADDGKILVSEKREQTIKNKCEKFVEIYKMNSKNKDFANWYFEKQLLGYSYDKRLKDVYTNNKFIVGIEKVLEGETKEQFLTIGTIKDIYNGKTKNGDKKYCRLTVVDEVAEITCFIWEEKLLDLQNAGILLEKGSIVSLNLSKMGGDAASVNQVSNITDSIYMKLSDLK